MEDEAQIEYLDEDEDLVQQYVKKTTSFPTPVIHSIHTGEDIEDHITPLLVERKREIKRKIKSDDDSDYDPNEDLQVFKKRRVVHKKPPTKLESTYITRNQKKTSKPNYNHQTTIQNLNKNYENKLKSLPNLTVQKRSVAKIVEAVKANKRIAKKLDSIDDRKKLDIRIPDYEDPLCLPVRAIKRDEYDVKKLKVWNNLCLEQLRKADSMYRSNKSEAIRSMRTIVLKNLKNKFTGRIDTSVYGKVTVENGLGQRKAETFQGTLPKYRERKVLNSFPLILGPQRYFKHTYEAILTKENQKDEDVLVVYKPREAVSAVYKCTENNVRQEVDGDDATREKMVMKEVTCCKMCAPCYQASWRSVRKPNTEDNLKCAVCSRPCVCVYNLLSHLNTNHSPQDVAKHKAVLSKTLASVVEYHYRCRVCWERFPSIKMLRKHVSKHQGVEVFKCEIGNHLAS